LFFVLALCVLFLILPSGLVGQHIFEVTVIDPELELVDVVRGTGDPEDMSFNLVHEVEVDVEETVWEEGYFFSV
jgi:hypothetical protein